MAALLAAAAILVITAAAVSLLMALPAVALAETDGPLHAAGRARIWLAALLLPPLTGIAAAVAALSLHAQGTIASPHIGGLRPHLCLLPLLDAPAGTFVLRSLAWLSLLLVIVALLRMLTAATVGHLLRRMVVASGVPMEAAPEALVVELGRPVSFNAGLLRPVVVVSASLRAMLDPEALEAMLAHERAHAVRRDNVLLLIAEVCALLAALSPAAWYARGRLKVATEEAADDATLMAGVQPEAVDRALAVATGTTAGYPRTPSLTDLLIPSPPLAEHRRMRLAQIDSADLPASAGRGRLHALLAAGVGVALLVLLAATARLAVEDTLFCAAEQLIAAVR